jgi:hypothetical protein
MIALVQKIEVDATKKRNSNILIYDARGISFKIGGDQVGDFTRQLPGACSIKLFTAVIYGFL